MSGPVVMLSSSGLCARANLWLSSNWEEVCFQFYPKSSRADLEESLELVMYCSVVKTETKADWVSSSVSLGWLCSKKCSNSAAAAFWWRMMWLSDSTTHWDPLKEEADIRAEMGHRKEIKEAGWNDPTDRTIYRWKSRTNHKINRMDQHSQKSISTFELRSRIAFWLDS